MAVFTDLADSADLAVLSELVFTEPPVGVASSVRVAWHMEFAPPVVAEQLCIKRRRVMTSGLLRPGVPEYFRHRQSIFKGNPHFQ